MYNVHVHVYTLYIVVTFRIAAWNNDGVMTNDIMWNQLINLCVKYSVLHLHAIHEPMCTCRTHTIIHIMYACTGASNSIVKMRNEMAISKGFWNSTRQGMENQIATLV